VIREDKSLVQVLYICEASNCGYNCAYSNKLSDQIRSRQLFTVAETQHATFFMIALFIGIFTGITAVVHFTNVQDISQRLFFWYHFTFDSSEPHLSGVSFTARKRVESSLMLQPTVSRPVWGLRPDFYCQRFAVLLMWGVLSEERTGLLFTIAAAPRQRSHSRVQVPWDSRPYFTVSDLRLPFLSPPTTHWAMVNSPIPG
jgi:hypothetical protein